MEAGINHYRYFIADLSGKPQLPAEKYDVIIADVPCTGSGTWARTPEQLYFFSPAKIEHYSNVQKSIISTVISYLKPGGFLVYITCSVFKKENEDVLSLMMQNGLTVVSQQIFAGYHDKADTLFGALVKAPIA